MKRMMTIVMICAALAVPAFAAPAQGKTIQLAGKSADGPMGIGIFLGQPTGLTFEMDLSTSSWVDFKAAWNLAGPKGGYSILLQGNYEYAFPGMFAIESELFTPFFGGGAVVDINDTNVNFGVRVPAGIAYRFRHIPLELFIEAGIDVYLFPSFALGGSGGLGARLRF
ncbi:MAG TPA: hypothetical protein VMX33_00075 [bacterium]|nr:hypothetical protein [bacterium]